MMLRHLLLCLLVSATRVSTQGQVQKIPTITNGADVLFVLDGSQRVNLQQWHYLQTWLQQLVEYWNIGPSGVQVGFYTYGGGVQQQYALNQAGSFQQAVQEVQGLSASGGSATAGQAIRSAYREGFSAQNGGRGGVPKIIVHVNSGPAADPTFYQQQVKAAKQAGVAVYNVGVGAGAANPQMASSLASEPSSRYVLPAESFNTLETLTGPLATRIADELPAGQGATLPAVQGSCLSRADIVFMVDGSSSVGDANYQRLMNYVKTFSGQLPVSQDGVHVGLMQFSSRPEIEFGLGVYTDRGSLLKGIDNVQYLGGGTNTADALQSLRTQMFSQAMGARPGVPRIAVVVTDGRSSSMADTVKEADLARQNHISLLAVGVGSGVNSAELQGIADHHQDVFQVDDFNSLPSLTSSILQRSCQVQATAAPLSVTLSPNVHDTCLDKLANCNMYDENMCTEYAHWAQENCNKTCRICSPLKPDVLPPCADKLDNCAMYNSSMCTDSRYKTWVVDNCALFCGFCGTDVSSTGYYGQCYYKNKAYNTGETWSDGCDYQCTCENGNTGQYKCYNKCPIYTQMPSACTLVQTPGECCLKPVCNFNPTVQSSITSGLGTTPDGMNVCEYQGHQYVQGESWDVGCTLKCVCDDANTGKIRCQDYCPTYSVLPSNCKLQKSPGQCCAQPVCEFNSQTGSITGMGQVSGPGSGSRPTQPPPCVDKLDNCAQYTDSACSADYREWAADNCRKFCGLCSDGRVVPSATDRCTFQSKQYKQGETWSNGCDQECVCEQAVYGYYRCYSLCPVYNNVPAGCTRKPGTGSSCCETITCPQSTRLVPSTTNVLSIGSGNNIMQPDPLTPGHMVPVVPSLPPPGATLAPNTPVQGYQAPTIQGCLYRGRLYVQGQRWNDGCDKVCECTSASQGLYTCTARCPTYQNLPLGCNLEPDAADACCRVAKCQAGVNYVPVPVFQRGTVQTGVAKPPNPNELMATSSTVLVTQSFPQSANSPPTMPTGPVPTGGIGYCEYKGQQYRQSESWVDGCDYNCLCQDASTGFWVCSDRCLTYPPMPQYCRLVVDQQFPCCKKPYCEIPGIRNSTYGRGSTHAPIITTRPPLIITSTTPARPAMCMYKAEEYSQGQEWFDGCDYKCTCYDATANLYSCTDRCPTFFGLDESRCTEQPDPRDPTCCSIPVCKPATPPIGTTAVPTVPGGSFENTNSPGIVGYCDYKGTHYLQGDRWDDGCLYSCECLDATNGRYRCDEKCPRFPNLPAACRLVVDFANPCCKKPTCSFTGQATTINGQANLHTPAPILTPSPGSKTPVCVFNSVEYHQGQEWEDGCNLKCRCEDAQRGLYVCDQRCAEYGDLPAGCMLVADPKDQCCRIPQCTFKPTSGSQTGQGNPTPFPTYVPGKVTGQVNVPTPGPNMTPAPIGFCVYKGTEYGQGETWEDGCDFNCRCEDANIGKYVCDEKCPKFPNLPSQCRLFRDLANPCCMKPDCSFPTTSGTISGHGSTPAPPLGSTLQPPLPGQSTLAPNPSVTLAPGVVTPSPSPVCVYRGGVYAEGQTWYDDCNYVCVCEKGSQGTYRCNDRCPSYPNPENAKCTMKPDPSDPMCCQVPQCDTPVPTPVKPNGPYIVPTLRPQGVVTGGSVTVTPTPIIPPTPGPDGSTLRPPLVSTPQPRAVCVYKGQGYSQGQKWQDGCDYNCECIDAPNGHYKCTEMCPNYPPLPAGCYMVHDVYNPCCQTPVCPFPPTMSTLTLTPLPGTTLAPVTGPDGHTLRPPVINTPAPRSVCIYNGVPYRTGDTWEDGCDLKCRCEDETKNLYRCDQRCARYDPVPAGCTMVTDPRDACCLAPFCEPVLPPTAAPNMNPNHPATPRPTAIPIPTAIPGKTVGNSVNNPNVNNPNNETSCAYNGKLYRQSETWVDGCDKTCVCTDQKTGRYECKERCPQYLNVPPYCTMVTNPDDQCCEKPVCTNPNTLAPGVVSTLAPNPLNTDAPNPMGSTLAPNPLGSTLAPNPNITPAPRPSLIPQPRNACTYKNGVYVEGQQWYDDCDKVCVCEDGTTGYYRCTDRCKAYSSVPAGCTLVVDPQDPNCCKVPQCAPTPGPYGYPTPRPGQSPTPYTVTNVPGIVTGRAPTPTPGTDGKTPVPRTGCVYKGRSYARGQQWQDGCEYKCVCDNEITGEYTCTERCNTYPMVPPQCKLARDPKDFCCQVMTCDLQMSTPNPYLTLSPAPATTAAPPHMGPTTPPPTPNPNLPITPRPIPVGSTLAPNPNQTPKPNPTGIPMPQSFCVYKGVAYRQGDSWQEGCSKTCRCDDADKDYYTCFDRCPKYDKLDPRCILTLDPSDQCCQMPVCPDIPRPTLGPNQTPSPGVTPAPTPTPYPVPQKVPTGSITGNNPNPNTNPSGKEGFCVYKGSTYKQGQTWDDGCDYSCTCIDELTGRYVCNEKCDKYTNIPNFCVLTRDLNNQCCMKPVCTPPVTQAPPQQHTLTPPVGVTLTPVPGQSTLAPIPGHPTPPAVGLPTPVPRSVCVMNGRSYTQGQQWYDGCSQICVCENESTGFYRCRDRCATYQSDPTCVSVPDPNDPACCTIPQCPNPQNPNVPPGHKGTITGNGRPPTPNPYVTPLPGHTLAPHPGSTQAPTLREVCVYKGQDYRTGQRWRDGCDFVCVCEDGKTGQYKCTDRCNKYPPLTGPGCRMVPDPDDACCQQPTCTPTPAPSLNPNLTPGPGQPTANPTPSPNQVPNTAVCVYQGVPYRQGATWNDGCDKTCRCEDGMTGTVNCDDRCPKYPNTKAGCRMVTDPQDSCCQIPQCENPNTKNPTQVITGVPGIITGNSMPPQNPLNPLQPKASECMYRGKVYQQSERWDDGCSASCVCDDGHTGHYTCTERCARVPNAPSTCHMLPDPMDLCCQVLSCPVPHPTATLSPHPQSTLAPFPYTGPPTLAPPLGSTLAPNPFTTAAPQPRTGMCLYKNQYYREKQVWYDGCDAICTCEDGNTGFYRCQERCGDYPNVDNSCIMVADPKDPTCCKMPECPLIPPGGTTPAGPTIIRPPMPTAIITNYPTPAPVMPPTQAPPLGPDGHTLVPPMGSTKAPTPRTGCLYKGMTYHENEKWDDGCDFKCECLSEQTGQYRCAQRCPRMPSVPNFCVLIADPQDSCCQVPYCDMRPTPFPNGYPTPGVGSTLVPGQNPTTPYYIIPGFVTKIGNQPTLSPQSNPGIVGGGKMCVYQGVQYRQGATWDDGCDKTCVCDANGLYTCRDKCQSFPNLDPACKLRVNPAEPCCLVPDCNPNYVTSNPGTGFTGANPFSPGTGPGYTGSGSTQYITPGFGPGFTGSVPPIGQSQAPGFTGTRAPILVPTAAPGVFTGQRPPLLPGQIPSITGYGSSCVYKGVTYQQGAKWDDGCQYKCECVDARKGSYRCTERCSNMYFLPKECKLEADPNDACCQRARCSPDSFPTPTPRPVINPPKPKTTVAPVTRKPTTRIVITATPGPVFQGTRSPVGSTITSYTGKPHNKCVFTDGRTFSKGETWTDGCAYTCTCDDAVQNLYKCDYRCPVYSDIPSFCQLENDPQDTCCQKVACQPVGGNNLVPSIAGTTPTMSPTLRPGIINVVPIGTHTIISGSGLVPGETQPGFFGGRQVCIYKGVVHMPGDRWDDGCDYTCECLDREPAVYSCTSKCPKFPPIPQYCSMVSVPGQCCRSLKCNIPNAGAYNPTPQLYPGLVPTKGPIGTPVKNPQLFIPSGSTQIIGGQNPPGGGTVVAPSTLGGINDRCVYQETDGSYHAYTQGEKWRVNKCDYECECIDSRSGYYECKHICPDYNQGNLPRSCSLQTVQGECCPALRCTNPDGTVVNPLLTPQLTKVPVYGVMTPGYSGFRPGYIPGHTNSISGYKNVCVYKGKPYQQGSRWDDGCDYTCDCTDGNTGLYTCKKKCERYTALPPVCHLRTVPGECCGRVQCDIVTHAPTTPTTPPTTPAGPCVSSDKLANCAAYDKAASCGGLYEAWARENCPVYCGYCQDANPTTPGPCVDVLPNCAQYDPSSCTGQYEAWARDNCAKTCDLCPCYDTLPTCNKYGAYACGGVYESWARENCAKTCNLCSKSKPQATVNPGVSLPAGSGSGVVPNGWTLILKGVAGAPGDLWNLWASPNTANTNVPAAQRLTSEYMGHYKPPLANSLDVCDFDKIKVAVYNNGVEKANVVFDGHNTGRDSWFDSRRIIESTFSDIKTQQQFLKMAGDPATGHEFYLGQPVSGCSGSGWMMVSTRNTCSYESGTNPGFYYSSTGTTSAFTSGNMQSGDVFAIMGQGGSCALGVTTPHSFTATGQPVCVFNGKIYHQDDWWQDGCQYNCTCQNAATGFYRCYDLCDAYTNLPPQCSMIKQPGDCCAKPTGPGCDVSTASCMYQGKVYKQGQTWNDGCDFQCECIDGTTGRYECNTLCLQFNLPDVCHFDPAPAGKCCPVPNCPSNIQVKYPPGYQPR